MIPAALQSAALVITVVSLLIIAWILHRIEQSFMAYRQERNKMSQDVNQILSDFADAVSNGLGTIVEQNVTLGATLGEVKTDLETVLAEVKGGTVSQENLDKLAAVTTKLGDAVKATEDNAATARTIADIVPPVTPPDTGSGNTGSGDTGSGEVTP